MGRQGEAEINNLAASPRHPFSVSHLLRFLMASVFAATPTEFLKLQPVGRGFLILCRCVVAALAVSALEHNVIARHN